MVDNTIEFSDGTDFPSSHKNLTAATRFNRRLDPFSQNVSERSARMDKFINKSQLAKQTKILTTFVNTGKQTATSIKDLLKKWTDAHDDDVETHQDERDEDKKEANKRFKFFNRILTRIANAFDGGIRGPKNSVFGQLATAGALAGPLAVNFGRRKAIGSLGNQAALYANKYGIDSKLAGHLGSRSGGLTALKFLSRSALGVVGSVLAFNTMGRNYNSLHGRRASGESFFGMGQDEPGLLKSRFSSYLENTVAGGLGGAAAGTLFGPAGTLIGGIIGAGTGLVTAFYADFKEEIDKYLGQFARWLKDIDFQELGYQTGESIKGALSQFFTIMGSLFSKNNQGFIKEWGGWVLITLLDFVKGLGQSLLDGLVSFLNEKIGLDGGLDSLQTYVGDKVTKLVNDGWTWVSNFWEDLVSWLPFHDSRKDKARKLIRKGTTEDWANADRETLMLARAMTAKENTENQAWLKEFYAMSPEERASKKVQKEFLKRTRGKGQDYRLAANRIEEELNKRTIKIVQQGRPLEYYSSMGYSGAVPSEYSQAVYNISAQRSQGARKHANDIYEASQITGQDFGTLMAFADRESSFDANAKSSTGGTATGLFQFTNGTWKNMWKKYGDQADQLGLSRDRTDARSNAVMAGFLMKDNYNYLKNKLKREPGSEELYMAHFMGPEKAVSFIKAATIRPNDVAAGYGMEAKYNPTIFTKDATYADIYKKLSGKITSADTQAYAREFSPEVSTQKFMKNDSVDAAKLPPRPMPQIISEPKNYDVKPAPVVDGSKHLERSRIDDLSFANVDDGAVIINMGVQ